MDALNLNAGIQKSFTLNSLGLNGAGDAKNAEGTGLGKTFGDLLKKNMTEISQLQAQADRNVETLATGGNIELHNVILSVEKADMALQLAAQIRNKLIGAYQEISRMNV